MEELQCSREVFEQLWSKLPEGGSFSLVVTGSSMRPTLRHGKDQVILKKIRGNEARVYDIVLFQRKDGSWVLHRLLKKTGALCTMNGDGQVWTETADEASVCARVTALRRGDKGEIRADSRLYRLYVYLWVCCRRLRPLIFKVGRKRHT